MIRPVNARAGRLAWGLWTLVVFLTVLDVAALARNLSRHGLATTDLADPAAAPLRILLPLFAVTFMTVGAMVASRLSRNVIGWLFAVGGAEAVLQALMVEYAIVAGDLHGGLPAGPLLAALSGNLGQVGFLAFFSYITFLFPDGRFASRRWGLAGQVAGVLLGVAAAARLTVTLAPHAFDNFGHEEILGLCLVLPPALAVASLVARFRHSGSEQRQQIKWILYASLLVAATVGVQPLLGALIPVTTPPLVIELYVSAVISTIVLIPIAAGVAILKYRLYDIDVVISRTLVYGALAAFITVVYVVIVVGVGNLVGSGGRPNLELSIVATAVVAVGFQPVRERLQRLANRVVYGKRATPYEVLAEFSERVSETYSAADVLPRMARVLADGTGAQRAEVWLRQGDDLRRAAVAPAAPGVEGNGAAAQAVRLSGDVLPVLPEADRAVAVRHQGELLGALAVRKRGGESLSPMEEKLLEDLANQAGLVLKNVGLTADLQARLEELRESRKRLVAAQDAERRRLERNLHDGAQQHLVALKVKLGLAEALADKDPEKARATLQQLKGDADEALETLRDLARGIYPPMLAERGLVAALEAHARKATVAVSVSAEAIGRYPQDTEAAVYFCVLEALQNVQKYARATRAVVSVAETGGRLEFTVEDDGLGFDPASTPGGSGLQNMRDRVEALGGSLSVESAPGRGTRLNASLPVGVLAPESGS